MRSLKSLLGTATVLFVAMNSAQALTATVVCAKKGVLQIAIDKFDKSQANTLNISGNCVENAVIDGHRDLTLVGDGSAQITASAAGAAALEVRASRVTLRNMLVNHAGLAETGVQCTDRSACVLDGSSVVGGVMAQNQSAIDILAAASTSISGSPFAGVGA